MKNVCTVDKMTPLTTHLLNALSPGHLQVMFSNGLIQLTLVGSPPTTEEILFGIFGNSLDKKIMRKFNYTLLFMRHYLHSNKLCEKSISLKEFVPKVEHKYRLENIK